MMFWTLENFVVFKKKKKKTEYDDDDDDDDCGQIFKFNSHTHTCRFYICFIFLPHWLLNTNTHTHNEKWKSFNLDGSRVYMIYKHFVSGCFFYRSQSIHSHIKYEKKWNSAICKIKKKITDNQTHGHVNLYLFFFQGWLTKDIHRVILWIILKTQS